MDPLTTMVVMVMMTLLNGAMLGFIRGELPTKLKASAASWRIGSLLIAAGFVLLAVQSQFPPYWILPAANACLALGVTGYWRAVRQFFQRQDRVWMLLPTVVGVFLVWWFAAIDPQLGMRIVAMSVAMMVILGAAAWTLFRRGDVPRPTSQVALAGLFLATAAFLLVRSFLGWYMPPGPGTLLDSATLVNRLTPVIIGVLPVTGTTAFLLLCADQIRRDWEHAASTDALTGLMNRRSLSDRANAWLAEASAPRSQIALAVIDVDHFKQVNDRYGHGVGDLALRFVADHLRRSWSPQILLGRQGGEEFVAVFRVRDSREALSEGARVLAELREAAFDEVSPAMRITASMGLSLWRGPADTLDQMMHRADAALYRAKHSGRDRALLETESTALDQAPRSLL